jgi:hypothetical protein
VRCYFLRDGRVGGVAHLTKTSDNVAIEQARILFEKHKDRCSGFEVWDRARLVYRHPIGPKPPASVNP